MYERQSTGFEEEEEEEEEEEGEFNFNEMHLYV
jgi:hypothetical protein